MNTYKKLKMKVLYISLIIVVGLMSMFPIGMPVQATADYTQLSAGNMQTIYQNQKGDIWVWGNNLFGQMASETNLGLNEGNLPTQLDFLSQAKDILSGVTHFVVLDKNNELWTWGSNSAGQLGRPENYETSIPNAVPVQLTILDDGNPVKFQAVAGSAGASHVLALDEDGRIWSFGSNNYGQLGNGNEEGNWMPTHISVTDNGSEVRFQHISAGQNHSLAIDTNGEVWAWGFSRYGAAGVTQEKVTAPQKVSGLPPIEMVAAGSDFSLALDVEGKVWSFGNNQSGQLGVAENNWTITPNPTPINIPELSGITHITAGYAHGHALTEDGVVWTWGMNNVGQAGVQYSTYSPQKITDLPPIKAISAGYWHSNAVDVNNKVWGWGAAYNGAKGVADTVHSYVPVPVNTSTQLDLSLVGIDVLSGTITNTKDEMEYSLNSTNGTDGNWETASDDETTVLFGSGTVYVREKENTENYRLVATIASPAAAPYVTAEVSGGKSAVKLIGANTTMEYSIDGGTVWNPVTSDLASGAATLDLSAVGDLRVRVKATSSALPSKMTNRLNIYSANSEIGSLILSDVTLNTSVRADIYTYTATVGYEVDSTIVNVVPADSTATYAVRMNGQPVSNPIMLNVGSNVMEVIIQAQDEVTEKTYTVTITRQGSSDARIKQLTVGAPLEGFSSSETSYTYHVPYSTDLITVSADVYHEHSTLLINREVTASGQPVVIPLEVGNNIVSFEVTAENTDNQMTYTVNVVRAGNNDAGLSDLVLSEGSITFDANTTEYDVTVPYSADTLAITPTISDANATIVVNGTVAVNGESAIVTLNDGLNEITIVVTAQDGISTNVYTLNVTRQPRQTGGSSGGSSPASPQAPTRQVNVVLGDNANIVSKVDITRSLSENGKQVDSATFDEKNAVESVKHARTTGNHTARIVIDDLPDAKADEIVVNISRAAIHMLSDQGVSLQLQTPDVTITLPKNSMTSIQASDIDLYFRVVPIFNTTERETVENRVVHADELLDATQDRTIHIIGNPMKIETNYESRTTYVEFSLKDIDLPVDSLERQAFLQDLMVYIEHSDGDKAVQQGSVKYDANGEPVGLEIRIDKFSTFTIVKVNSEILRERYVYGFEKELFKPENPMTRAELAAVMARHLKLPPTPVSDFHDVAPSHWASGFIAQMQSAGMMTGDSQRRFRPDQPLTRAEMAAVIARWGELDVIESDSDFTDMNGHWSSPYVRAVSEQLWIVGYEDGTFRPDQPITRAEAVKLLNKLFDRPGLEGKEQPTWQDVSPDHWAYTDIEAASNTYWARPLPNGNEQFIRKQ